MSDIKTSPEGVYNFAISWDQEVRNEWPESYPASLTAELKKLNVSTILDCAGGTGYPSIELKQLGWDITYSDGSATMLELFTKRLEETNLDIPAYLSRWEDLSKNLPNTYDALMCAGNSFIGINSYDSPFSNSDDQVKSHMQLAASEFYKMLNPGGVLYIDLFVKEFAAPEQPFCLTLTSDTHHLFRTISYDPVRNMRTNLTTKTSLIDGTETDTITKLIPLFNEDLIALLLEAGFSRVERSPVDDAKYVNSFFAFKD